MRNAEKPRQKPVGTSRWVRGRPGLYVCVCAKAGVGVGSGGVQRSSSRTGCQLCEQNAAEGTDRGTMFSTQ